MKDAHPLTPYDQPTNLKAINDDKVDFISTALGVRTEMVVEMVRAAMECVQLFDTKQQDYGSNNISSSGELGIAVRLQDKVSRMRHILLKELTEQEISWLHIVAPSMPIWSIHTETPVPRRRSTKSKILTRSS